MYSTPQITVGRVLWALVPAAYCGLQLFVVTAWPVPYEFLHHTISDLGWTTCTTEHRPGGVLESCSPRHAWFNAISVVLWMLLAAGGFLLRGLYAGRRRARWIMVFWMVIAVFGTATSVIPGNVNLGLHSVLALPLFLGTIAVLVLSALALRPTAPLLAAAAAVAAVVSLLGLGGLLVALAGIGPVGLMERLAAETVYLWILLVGLVGPPQAARQPLSRSGIS